MLLQLYFVCFVLCLVFNTLDKSQNLPCFLGNAPIIVNSVREEGTAGNRRGIDQGAKIVVNFLKMGQHTFVKCS